MKTMERDGITGIEESYFTAPYKIAKPFYSHDRKVMNIMVMSASAGIMEGDRYQMDLNLGKCSVTALHGQSYSKIHRMKDGFATQQNRFTLDEGAFFDYVQKPVIPFEDSRFYSKTECRLKKGSAYLCTEVLACGREKMGERFAFKEYGNTNRVYYNDELIYLDNQKLVPCQQELKGIGFFEGYTHQASLLYFNDNLHEFVFERCFDILNSNDEIDSGITKTYKFGMAIRMMGRNSDSLERLLSILREEIYMARNSF